MNDLLDKFEEEISNKFNLRIKELEDKIKNLENEKLRNEKFKNDSSITIYTLQYPNGDIYEGTGLTKNNMFNRDGIGKMTYANGEIYSGCWKNHKRHGKGKLLKNGSLKIGVWNNDEIDGNSKESIYDLTNEPIIRSATTTTYKDNKRVKGVNYRSANAGQYAVGGDSVVGYWNADIHGNIGGTSCYSGNQYTYRGGQEQLDISANTLYL
jgi:hypothetical protein